MMLLQTTMKKETVSGITCLLFLLFSSVAVADPLIPELSKRILEKFPRADRNGDGKLAGQELVFVQKVILKRNPGADTDGDGVLSKAEQKQFLKQLSGGNSPKTPAPVAAPETPEQLAKWLKQYPESDADGNGELSKEEAAAYLKALQNSRGKIARKGRGPFVPDPGWKEEKFPEHAICYLTPEQMKEQYGGSFPDLPKSKDGVLRVIGTGHSFMRPGYQTLPAICEAAGLTAFYPYWWRDDREHPLQMGRRKRHLRFRQEAEPQIATGDRECWLGCDDVGTLQPGSTGILQLLD